MQQNISCNIILPRSLEVTFKPLAMKLPLKTLLNEKLPNPQKKRNPRKMRDEGSERQVTKSKAQT